MLTRLVRRRYDDGYAMLLVIASILVMSILAAGALALSTGRLKPAKRGQNWQAALQAAQAGVDDYVARLQANPNYFTLGNSDAANVAMAGWATIPGGTAAGTFHYSVDTTAASTISNGAIKLTATGRVNGVDRTVSVTLGKHSFLDYMYYTEYETIDPVAYSSTSDQTAASTACPKHAYAPENRPDPGNNNYCQPIYFAGSDVLKGPVHSQDKIRFNGSPTFQSEFSTEWDDPAKKYWACAPNVTCNPSFTKAPILKTVAFPRTNIQLRQYADATQGGQGCLFKGPTRILFNGAGTMTVLSPETASTFNTGACGTRSWTTAQTINVPTGQVIYVDSYTGSCSSMPSGFPFPIANDANASTDPVKLRPNCNNGDAYVEGWVKGQVTIGTANNIIVTNSIRYVGTTASPTSSNLNTGIPTTSAGSPATADTATRSDGTTDLLGLAAANFVMLYHPLNVSNNNISSSPYPLVNVQIDAAIVASNDSFIVQDWDQGGSTLSALTIVGGIIQAFRGPVGTSAGTGYSKNYNYDSRLLTLTPPHLADLAASAWDVSSYGEGNAQ
jgi:type II secretory pathway pseudopilin PulG